MAFRHVLNAGLAAASVAGLAYPAIVSRRREITAGLFVTLVLATPYLVPGEARFGRFLAALTAVTMAVKVYDLGVGARLGHRPGWFEYLVSLPNPSSLVLRKRDLDPIPDTRSSLVRLARSSLAAAAGLLLFLGVFRIDWGRLPFPLEHTVKVLTFFAALVPAAAAGASALRLLGSKTHEPMDRPILARTPAEFWRRYNRAAHQFLREDVFDRAGGRRKPLRATLATFAVSALIHEYVMDVPAGRLQGYQSLFFLIQGLAVVATLRIQPGGLAAVAWIALTLAFNLATGLLFFASINEIVPFYVAR